MKFKIYELTVSQLTAIDVFTGIELMSPQEVNIPKPISLLIERAVEVADDAIWDMVEGSRNANS